MPSSAEVVSLSLLRSVMHFARWRRTCPGARFLIARGREGPAAERRGTPGEARASRRTRPPSGALLRDLQLNCSSANCAFGAINLIFWKNEKINKGRRRREAEGTQVRRSLKAADCATLRTSVGDQLPLRQLWPLRCISFLNGLGIVLAVGFHHLCTLMQVCF